MNPVSQTAENAAENAWLKLFARASMAIAVPLAVWFFLRWEDSQSEIHKLSTRVYVLELRMEEITKDVPILQGEVAAKSAADADFRGKAIERLVAVETEIKGLRNDLNRLFGKFSGGPGR